MTNPNYTHIAMLLDSSGSMQRIKTDTEGGFDAFITDQRTQPGTCTVTLADFSGHRSNLTRSHWGAPPAPAEPTNGHDYVVRYVGKDIHDVPNLILEPRGGTALLDSIARLIRETGEYLSAMPEDQRPGTVIFGIITDGEENDSHEFYMNHAAIKAMIEHQETVYGWTFTYMGANQDAIEVGASIGVAADRSLTYAGENVAAAVGSLSRATSTMRGMTAAGASREEMLAAAAYTSAERATATTDTPDKAAPAKTFSKGRARR